MTENWNFTILIHTQNWYRRKGRRRLRINTQTILLGIFVRSIFINKSVWKNYIVHFHVSSVKLCILRFYLFGNIFEKENLSKCIKSLLYRIYLFKLLIRTETFFFFVHELNHKMIFWWFMWTLHKNTYLAWTGYVNFSAMIATFTYPINQQRKHFISCICISPWISLQLSI